MKRTALVLLALIAIEIGMQRAQPARAQNYPPYYTKSGIGAASLSFAGFQGQGLCVFAAGIGTFSTPSTITGSIFVNGVSDSIEFWSSRGVDLGSSITVSTGNPSQIAFFKCPNVTMITLSSTATNYTWSLIVTAYPWPFTVGASAAPSPPTIAGSPPIVVSPGPVCSAPSNCVASCPLCVVKTSVAGGGFTWDALVCASDPSVTHCYPMNDPPSGSGTPAPGATPGNCTQLQDRAIATALPSAVPLPIASAGTAPQCGSPPITADGEPSVAWIGAGGGEYFALPASIWPTSGAFSIEIVEDPQIPFASLTNDQLNFLFQNDGTGNFSIDLDDPIATGVMSHAVHWSGSVHSVNVDSVASDTIILDDFICQSNGSCTYYHNGIPAYSAAGAAYFNNGTAGSLGGFAGSTINYTGRLAKFAIANTAWSQNTIFAHMAALGLCC